jgi:hypothetical protein
MFLREILISRLYSMQSISAFVSSQWGTRPTQSIVGHDALMTLYRNRFSEQILSKQRSCRRCGTTGFDSATRRERAVLRPADRGTSRHG